MHTSRKLKTEAVEATLQLRNWQQTLSVENLIEEKLVHLQVFIDSFSTHRSRIGRNRTPN